MKIIYAGIQSEAYTPKRSESFEYINFYGTLKSMPGIEVIEYPFDSIITEGKAAWNAKLLDLVRREKPDLLFAFMYTDEFDPNMLRIIQQEKLTRTLAWFADDYWRFFNYAKRWATYFDHSVTTYDRAVEWYRKIGYTNVVLSQWGCNPRTYVRQEVSEQDIPVSFIGQHKPQRGAVISALARKGVNVQTFGLGWPNGRLSTSALLATIHRSVVNLNLNVRGNLLSPEVIGRMVLVRRRNWLVPDFHVIDNVRAYLHFPTLHTHARPFELAGAGGFVISGYSEGIERYYREDKEMVFYRSTSELADKVRYYLNHPIEREAIREAGYQRTLRDHTYEQRFRDIFIKIGLPLVDFPPKQ